jgi:hypothetical protein
MMTDACRIASRKPCSVSEALSDGGKRLTGDGGRVELVEIVVEEDGVENGV